jgi:hypothetical protein
VVDIVSFTVRSWHDPLTGARMLQVLAVDGEAAIRLADGLLVVRVTADERKTLYRSYVRHVATGREIIIQCGPDLGAFVLDCLMKAADTPPDGE